MKPRLVVDNSETTLPCPPRFLIEPPEIRLAAAWRAMQDVMRDHFEGRMGQEETLDLLHGYLSDPRLDADVVATEG